MPKRMMGWGLLGGLLLLGACLLMLPSLSSGVRADEASEDESSEQFIDPMSVNATCYICHMTFVHESISKEHFAEEVTCIDCHGVSAAHANDEDIGATKPDKIYKRGEIDSMCEKCHEEHDAPAQKVIARFQERKLKKKTRPVCTDCHGRHKIDAFEE